MPPVAVKTVGQTQQEAGWPGGTGATSSIAVEDKSRGGLRMDGEYKAAAAPARVQMHMR